MKCPYCQKNVIGEKKIVVVVGEGPAHAVCHERAIISQRVFGGLNLPLLNDEQLAELSDMVKMEQNSRDESQEDAIELFA